MSVLHFRRVIFGVAFITGCLSQTYSDLDALGINCPSRNKCPDLRNLTYIDRGCECDFNCTAYRDCCIDALPIRRRFDTDSIRPAARTDVKCLHYGRYFHTGVYVVSKCSDNWNGSIKVRQKCTDSDDFSDPLLAAPVTDVAQKETYRNLACAECNYVNLTSVSLSIFRLGLICPSLEELTEDEIMADMAYNSLQQLWGLYRQNEFGNGTEFFGCNIIVDVPEYLNNSVRFCRSNLVSTCAAVWKRPSLVRACARYMAAVYSTQHGYRNLHCAICNHKTLNVSCQKEERFARGGESPYRIIVDINSNYDNFVGEKPVDTPECPSGQVYDVFLKTCRQLVCALPGHFIVNGACVKN